MVKKKGLPEWGENVFCTTKNITPFAAWCVLDEYEMEDGSEIEGMIHISQVAGRWVKDIRNFVKPNKQYVAKVIKIDYQKGTVNLSLKRVTSFEKREKLESFRRGKRASGMLTQMAKIVGKSEEDVRREVLDKLEKSFERELESGLEKEVVGLGARRFDLFSALEEANENPASLEKAGISGEWLAALKQVLEKSFRIKEKTLRAALNLSTTAPDGVNIIKKAASGLEGKTGARVKYISAPKYIVEVRTKTPKDTEKKLKEGLEEVVNEIEAAGGEGSYKMLK